MATVGDFPSRHVQIQWPQQTFETGRVAIVQHHIGDMPLLSAVVYGVPKLQAHPQSFEDTERLLQPLTREIVLGRKGPRVIAGDYNHSATQRSIVRKLPSGESTDGRKSSILPLSGGGDGLK